MSASSRRQLYVVAALIEREGQVLLDRRKKGTHLAELWEFPGGKREPGESDEGALLRELEEELGVGSRLVGPEIARVQHAYEDFDLTLVLYPVELDGVPSAVDVAEIAWHEVAALASLPMPPADRPLLEKVLKWLETGKRTPIQTFPNAGP